MSESVLSSSTSARQFEFIHNSSPSTQKKNNNYYIHINISGITSSSFITQKCQLANQDYRIQFSKNPFCLQSYVGTTWKSKTELYDNFVSSICFAQISAS